MTRAAPRQRVFPRARRRPPRALAPAPPDPRSQERAPCTCAPSHRHYAPCVACVAWEHGSVLLVSGATMTKTQWVLLHELTEEVRP